ncbi:LTA synthase family protein [Streptococcus sp. E17BB]|uniref:LTA synthase family protein n=1 Tax=Streptococcus sp. E17BB TaxID=3278714 RepID=UPI00359E5710
MWSAVICWGLANQIGEVYESANDQAIWLLPAYAIGFLLILIVTRERRTWRDILAVLAVYAIFFYAVYMQVMTGEINNPNFNENFFITNELYEFHRLPTLGIFLIFGVVKLNKLRFYQLIDHHLPSIPLSYALAGIIGLDIMSHSKIIALYQNQLLPFLEKGSISLFLSQFLYSSLSLFSLITILCVLSLNGLKALFNNRSSLGGAVVTSFLMALWVNYHLQSGYKSEESLLGRYIFTGAVTYQLVFFAIFFLITYILFNRYLLSTLVTGIFSVLIVLVNQLKVGMRDEPLLLTDFVWLKEMGLLLSFVDKTLIYKTFLLIILLLVLYIFFRRRLFYGAVCSSLFQRIILLISLVGFVAGVFSIFSQEEENKIIPEIPVISRLNNEIDINWLGLTMNARYKSLAFVWTKQLTKSIMEKPDGYTADRLEDIHSHYTAEAEKINRERFAQLTDRTVIFILSESLSDPSHIPGVTISEPVLSNISRLKQTTSSGLMETQFYGGGTANMEFQSLTGLPFSNFSSSVSIAYTEVFPKMSYIPSISQFYPEKQRVAMHPAGAANYNRQNIYKSLKFAKFFAKEGSEYNFSNPKTLGVSISDETVYRNILDNLDYQESQFFSVITMQNHAPWLLGEPEHIVATGEGFTDEQDSNLTHYARLLYHTDQATQEFLEKLSTVEKKITVVFYGDHLPGLYPKEIFSSKPESQYQTDYFIWSNDQPEHKLSYPIIGPNDFIAQLLEHTGSKVTPYQALLTLHLKQSSLSMQDEELQALKDLQMVQYDLTVGKGYLVKHLDFFE